MTTLTVLIHGTGSSTGSEPVEIVNAFEQFYRRDSYIKGVTHEDLQAVKARNYYIAQPTTMLPINSWFLVTQGQGTELTQYNNKTKVYSTDSGIGPERSSFLASRPDDDDEIADLKKQIVKEDTEQIEEKRKARGQLQVSSGVVSQFTFNRAQNFSAARAGISDTGVFKNVERLINHLEKCAAAGIPITKVNMFGWSRGAVTCIRQAYRMLNTPGLENIRVNMFCIDPVAGAGQDDKASNHDFYAQYATDVLGRNVDHCIFMRSGNEDRFGLPALSEPTYDIGITDFKEIILPGNHTNLAYTNTASGKIVAHLCYLFLRDNGSLVGADKIRLREDLYRYFLDNEELLTQYDKLLGDTREYFDNLKKTSYFFKPYAYTNSTPRAKIDLTSPGTSANPKVTKTPRMTDDEYQIKTQGRKQFTFSEGFINDNHETVFRALYPRLGPGHSARINRRYPAHIRYFDSLVLENRVDQVMTSRPSWL